MIHLTVVDAHSRVHIDTLYRLLLERTPGQSISHHTMPTHGEHSRFVKSCPYKGWYLIFGDGDVVGATYITYANELGIFIFKEHIGKGYAQEAIAEMMKWYEGPFLANISPENTASQRFFTKLGFKMVQFTYKYGADDAE